MLHSMLHCSHCLIHCQADRLDDFVCCSGCGKILGQFVGGKYVDHSELPILDRATKLKRRKNENKKKRHEKIGIDSADPQFAT